MRSWKWQRLSCQGESCGSHIRRIEQKMEKWESYGGVENIGTKGKESNGIRLKKRNQSHLFGGDRITNPPYRCSHTPPSHPHHDTNPWTQMILYGHQYIDHRQYKSFLLSYNSVRHLASASISPFLRQANTKNYH